MSDKNEEEEEEEVSFSFARVSQVELKAYLEKGWEPFAVFPDPMSGSWDYCLKRQGQPEVGTLDIRWEVLACVPSEKEHTFQPGWEPFCVLGTTVFLRNATLRLYGKETDETEFKGLVDPKENERVDEPEGQLPGCATCKYKSTPYRLAEDGPMLANCSLHNMIVQEDDPDCGYYEKKD